MNASRQKEMVDDDLPQPFVAVLGTVAAEGLFVGEFFGCTLHGIHNDAWQRTRDIAYSHAQETGVRMLREVRLYAQVDVVKEVMSR